MEFSQYHSWGNRWTHHTRLCGIIAYTIIYILRLDTKILTAILKIIGFKEYKNMWVS